MQASVDINKEMSQTKIEANSSLKNWNCMKKNLAANNKSFLVTLSK